MKIPFEVRPEGLYCQWGDFYVDASRPVNQCIVTHAHGDHARWGHKHYIATLDSVPILHHRLGANLSIQGLEYGQKLKIGQCWVSLHPAGHIFGSAQIRIESREGIYVISGDYKRAQDPTCLPYEGIPCDVFVTESTFALPIYHWEDPTEIARKIYHWWQNNSAEDHPSVLFCYALGKAQRILSILRSFTEQPIYVHGAILPIANIYAEKMIPMLPFLPIGEKKEGKNFAKELILAPPSAAGTPWLKRFPTFRTASASGWMQVRGTRLCVGNHRPYTLITSALKREVNLESVLPDRLEKLPWAGQLGLRMAPLVSHVLSPNQSTLIFTNTRSQAERWHQALVELNPEWEPLMALHHSSIDKSERERIEHGMKEGSLRLVVCTSSLDLGIDFALVEKVLQIGSPKSIARLIQRAGRSSHRPMTPCHLAIVPIHALEVVELKGYRMALEAHEIESRKPLSLCFDVLIQHLATCAIGGGFTKIEMWKEITSTAAFAALKPLEYDQCLNFLMNVGVLHAYPEYHKLVLEDDQYKIIDKQIIQRHRMNIGVIASDPHVPVKLTNGKTIGAIEENFMADLEPGDRFLFGGRILELIQFRDLVATVRIGKGETKTAAVWQGSRLPFSAPLGRVLRKALRESDEGYPETPFLKQISDLQNKFSYLPHEDELLIESLKTREGWHLYLYPFEGKLIHQGLASLLAHRLTREAKSTFTLSSNDYGLELLSKQPIHEGLLTSHLFRSDHLEEEVQEILNLYELARGSFRDIARISGLVFQGYPGKHKRLTPFALPLYVERVSGQLTTETLADRIERIKAGWKTHD